MKEHLHNGLPTLVGSLSLFVAVLGCGEAGEALDLPTLNRIDVTGLPAGDASGTKYSGSYVVVSSSISGCHCRVGTCLLIHAQTGGRFAVAEQDGALTESAQSGVQSSGGVNADGTFWCGGYLEQPGNANYVRSDGQFRLVNDLPDSMQFTDEATFVGITNGGNLDCDFRVTGTAQYSGP